MMKIILLFGFSVFLISCNPEIDTNSVKQPVTMEDPSFLNSAIVTTAMSIEPLMQLPAGFHLDSLFKLDTVLNHKTVFYYPFSETDLSFNHNLRLFMEKHAMKFKPDERGDEFQSSVFELWLTAAEQQGRKQRFKFMMQSYYPGAAHYNHDSAMFNYQRK